MSHAINLRQAYNTYSAFHGVHMDSDRPHLHAVSDVVVAVAHVPVHFHVENLDLFENKIGKKIDLCMNNNNNRKACGKMFSL